MHLKYLKHQEIDKEKWDRCLQQSPESVLYACAFYLDIVAPNWCALVEENGDNYSIIIPLTTQKKYGITFLHQPLFCQQLGVFSVQLNILPIGQLLDIFFKHFAFASHYHFNIENTVSKSPKLSGDSHATHIVTHHTHLLSLKSPYATLYQNYSLDRKKNLKRAKKANLKIIESDDIEPLIQMFEQDIAKKIQGGVAPNAYVLLRKIYAELKKRQMCQLLYTQNAKQEINAGALFAFYQNKIIYLFNAAYDYARKENGRMFLIDYILKTHANSDKIFDFESPEIEAIAYFYQSFGAEAAPYQVLSFNHLPSVVNWFWKIKKYLRNLMEII